MLTKATPAETTQAQSAPVMSAAQQRAVAAIDAAAPEFVENGDRQLFQRCRDTVLGAAPGSGIWYVELGLSSQSIIDDLIVLLKSAGISAIARAFRDSDLLEVHI